MKKLFSILALFTFFLVASCTPEADVDEPTEQLTDPEKICRPGQPNC